MTPEKITVELPLEHAQSIAFLLGESYARWSMELDHYARQDDIYPREAMEHLDAIDVVRDQMTTQGLEWNQ